MPEPVKKKTTRRYIPPELLEKILLSLPLKSLLRFAAVSESWRGLVFGAEFRRRYRRREMIVLRVNSSGVDQKALACPLSSLSTDGASPFDLPFEASGDCASSGELRCFEMSDTLCLYNPSTRAWRKLPTPRWPPRIRATNTGSLISVSAYGLGYDPGTDDYKILKTLVGLHSVYGESELYSLKSDRWETAMYSGRSIRAALSICENPAFVNRNPRFITLNAVFIGGALHWLVYYYTSKEANVNGFKTIAILTFDVSARKYGKMAAPTLPEIFSWDLNVVKGLDLRVLMGRLSLCMNHGRKFVVWVMEDYGSGVWKKDLEIDYGSIQPLCYSSLRPLYFYGGGDGRVIKAVTSSSDNRKLFIATGKEGGGDDRSSLMENSRSFGSNGYDIVGSFTYVESLVSPFP